MTKNNDNKAENKAVNVFEEILKNKFSDVDIKESKSPKQLKSITEKTISYFREFAVNNNDIGFSTVVVLTEDGNLGLTPLNTEMLHSDVGEMMMKSLVRTVNKKENSPVHSILELMFVRGLFKISDNKEEHEREVAKYSGLSAEELFNHPDVQDYMVANIYKSDKAETNMYDVILANDKNVKEGFVVSPKPVKSEKIKYNKDKMFINYFE